MWGIPQASDAQCEVSSVLPPYSESQLMDSSPHDRSKWRHGIPRRVFNEVHYQIPVRVGPIDGLQPILLVLHLSPMLPRYR